MTTRLRVPLPPVTPAIAALLLSACALAPDDAPEPPEPADVVSSAATQPEPAPPEAIVIAPSRLTRDAAAAEPAPAEADELVARLRDAFSLAASDDPTVQREFDWYASHPEYIARVFDRGSRYLHHIAEALEERGMPSDLALLPIVESAFDPFAYSRGRASGLWQIIPGTGDMLGLKQNWWYDGRRDIVDSTSAALDYLEHLHQRFDGDWLLAVAGYNSGEGHVARAIATAEREGRETDFWNIQQDLRSETAAYVPKLLAIRDLVAQAEALAIELPAIANEPYFAIVETDGQIDIALAAEATGLGVETLYELNPGINRWATDPDGPHRLIVPADEADRIEAQLASLATEDRLRWTRHEITRGETLSQIAEDYETTPGLIREINGLASSVIVAGEYLMIPHASATSGQYSLSLDARTVRQQDTERDGSRIDYTVRAGDTLWSIAQGFGVSADSLAAWNAMAPGDVLSINRRIVVWTDDPVALALATLDRPAAVRQVNYVVRSGDSLAAIATRFRVTVGELLDWNELSADRYLQPGQSLVLYVDVTEQSS